ncbi:MAG: hypothetical protein CSA45_00705 [Gammaproteobacteria bacterium]|nr:MAG: hypothetical protein CSA45_00705 [Gammaproteobacteria bacterium]
MKLLNLFLCLVLTSTAVAKDKAYSAYTPLTDAACQTLETERTGDYYRAECPAKGGYTVEVVGSDLRYGVALIYGKRTVLYQVAEPFNIGKKAEWRFRQHHGKKDYYALIYRAYIARFDAQTGDFLPRNKDRQVLVVIRLNKEKSCLIGVIKQGADMNKKARQLADNPSAACIEQ